MLVCWFQTLQGSGVVPVFVITVLQLTQYRACANAGAMVIVFSTVVGFWTMWQVKALYYDRKRNMVRANSGMG